jgi:hypothetical protein
MVKTCLKLLKDSCSMLRKSLSLEAFACLKVRSLGHDGSALLSVVAQALLCSFLCASSPSLLSGDADDDYQWEVQAYKYWILYWSSSQV